MQILFISKSGEYSGLAHRLRGEGHNVIFTSSAEWHHCINDISWRPHFQQANMIFFGPDVSLSAHRSVMQGKAQLVNSDPEFTHLVTQENYFQTMSEMLNEGQVYEPGMTPIQVGGFWNGLDWVSPLFLGFQERSVFPMDLGVNPFTPPHSNMGIVVVPFAKSTLLYEGSLRRISDFLRKTSYRGSVGLSGHIYSHTPVWHHASFPMDSLMAEAIHSLKLSYIGDFYQKLISGTVDRLKLKDAEFAMAIRVLAPEPLKFKATANQTKHLFLHNVSEPEDDVYTYASGAPDLMTITSRGTTVREARHRAYRTAQNIFQRRAIMRLDVGWRVENRYDELLYGTFRPSGQGDLAKIQSWNWLSPISAPVQNLNTNLKARLH